MSDRFPLEFLDDGIGLNTLARVDAPSSLLGFHARPLILR
ncbi:protein of unknown function [Xenorhabdus nematophila AN6/1]|nr:protein of unknown function [Xenorhabdus nematophila AN6/1]